MATRRERVVLDLQDNFTAGMVKAAGATQLLDKALHGLDGSSTDVNRSLSSSAVETDRVSTSARKADASINQLTGRLRLMADVAAILGPSLVPIGAVAIPAVTGLASQLGFAALGAGSLVTAFQGVGDALKAVNQAALEPTAANLEKAQAAMAQLGPDAQAFVTRFQELRPVLRDIRDSSAAGWFPGLTEAMDSFERIGPEVGDLFEKIGRVGGDLVAGGLKAFAGPEWADFRAFISAEAPKALDTLGRTVGNLVGGLARLWQAFTPLNSDFSDWLLDASRSFQDWAEGLSQTEGFAEFVDYIRTNGPRVADALKAVGDAVLQIIEALAPLGGPSLKIIETFANAIAAIADSDLGTPIFAAVAALAAYNRMMQATIALQARLGFAGAGSAAAGAGGMVGFLGGGRTGGLSAATRDLRTYGALRTQVLARTTAETQRMNDALARSKVGFSGVARNAGPAALAIGMIGASTTDAGSALVSTNTAMGVMMGSMAGPWGALAGGIAGSMMDITAASKQMADALESNSQRAADTLLQQRTDWTNPAAWNGAKSDMLDVTKGYLGGIDLRNPSSILGQDALNNGKNAFKTDDLIKQAGAWKQFGEAIPIKELAQIREEMERAGGVTEWLADKAYVAQNGISDAFTETARAAGVTTQELHSMVAAMDAQTQAALVSFDAETQWRQAMKAAQAQAATNRAGIRGTSEAALANRSALAQMAAAWHNQSEAVKSSDARFKAARGTFIQTAVAMGVPIERARTLAKELLGIPPSRKVKVAVETGDSIPKVHGLISALSSVKDKTVHINTVFSRNNIDSPVPSADGGSVPKTGLPYADRHPYLLADGEEVISNRFGQADRHRGLLKAINANRLASGGTAGPSTRSYTPDFGHGLDRAIRSLTVAVDADARSLKQRLKLATQARGSHKESLDLQRQERDALRDAIKDRLTSDIFAKSDVYQLDRPDMAGMSAAEQAKAQIAWIEMNEQLRKAQQSSPEDILRRDIAQGREFAQLTKTLKAKGLDGSALSALLSGGDMAQIEAYANGSRKDIATYERLFERRERSEQSESRSPAPCPSIAGCPEAKRRGHGQWGRLFFGYFLLARQKKVTAPPGAIPASSASNPIAIIAQRKTQRSAPR